MPELKMTALLLSSLLISGCVSQRYVGVQITSTEPMSMTRVQVNGSAVVLCHVGDHYQPQPMREKQ